MTRKSYILPTSALSCVMAACFLTAPSAWAVSETELARADTGSSGPPNASMIATNKTAPIASEVMGGAAKRIRLPAHIPAECVSAAAKRYQVPEMALLAVMRQESGGRIGIVSKNKNGSRDLGPAQLNSQSWGKYMHEKYGISYDAMTNNMCQALMSQSYAIRTEWNGCIKQGNTSIWCGLARYHSRTPKYQTVYIRSVWKQYQNIMARGEF